MAIQSNAFGRTVLTDADAKKFKSQASNGRPKATAKDTAKRGSSLLQQMNRNGRILIKTK